MSASHSPQTVSAPRDRKGIVATSMGGRKNDLPLERQSQRIDNVAIGEATIHATRHKLHMSHFVARAPKFL